MGSLKAVDGLHGRDLSIHGRKVFCRCFCVIERLVLPFFCVHKYNIS